VDAVPRRGRGGGLGDPVPHQPQAHDAQFVEGGGSTASDGGRRGEELTTTGRPLEEEGSGTFSGGPSGEG